MKQQTWLWAVVLGGAAMALGCADEPTPGPDAVVAPAAVTPRRARKAPPSRTLAPNTRFTIRAPDSDAVKQIASEFKARRPARHAPARPRWRRRRKRSGSPAARPPQVQAAVHKTMQRGGAHQHGADAGRLRHSLPRLRRPLGRGRARHAVVRGLDRRLRGRDRQPPGGRHPRARQPGPHPQRDNDRRRADAAASPMLVDSQRPSVPDPNATERDPLHADQLRGRLARGARAGRLGLPRRHAQRLAERRRGLGAPLQGRGRSARRASTSTSPTTSSRPTSSSSAPGSRSASRTPPRSRRATSATARTSTGTAGPSRRSTPSSSASGTASRSTQTACGATPSTPSL